MSRPKRLIIQLRFCKRISRNDSRMGVNNFEIHPCEFLQPPAGIPFGANPPDDAARRANRRLRSKFDERRAINEHVEVFGGKPRGIRRLRSSKVICHPAGSLNVTDAGISSVVLMQKKKLLSRSRRSDRWTVLRSSWLAVYSVKSILTVDAPRVSGHHSRCYRDSPFRGRCLRPV